MSLYDVDKKNTFINSIELNIKNAYILLESLSPSKSINNKNIKKRINLFIKQQNELLLTLQCSAKLKN
jgi:hypothetical protein